MSHTKTKNDQTIYQLRMQGRRDSEQPNWKAVIFQTVMSSNDRMSRFNT